MSRNNEQRTARHSNTGDVAAAVQTMKKEESFKNPLEFVTPTDFVTLPSRGRGYPTDHPLHNKEVIEIKFMTAKEEDILTSKALLKKNLAIERLIQSVILDKKIKAKDLLVGDRNAILVAARASGYGEIYEAGVTCPACGEKSKVEFNLSDPDIREGGYSEHCEVEATASGTYIVVAPVCGFKIELKLMTGEDEAYVMHAMAANKKNKLPESSMSEQYKRMIVSVEGHTDRRVINHFLQNAPARDLRSVRIAYKEVSPDVKITSHFNCPSCGHEQEMEVPFGADFFWPDR